MKQLEQEKDMLLQGLEVAERLRDWYHKQIATVTEKQNYVEKTSCSVCSVLFKQNLLFSKVFQHFSHLVAFLNPLFSKVFQCFSHLEAF